MDERYIIAPAALKAELFGAELNAVSAHGLLEHVLEPPRRFDRESSVPERVQEARARIRRSVQRRTVPP